MALPESIGQLTSLQSLDLSHNQLTVLPESIGKLTRVLRLNLAYNQLTGLPESMGELTQLQNLNLEDNQFTMLPMVLIRLKELQTLNLSNFKSRKLPDWLSQIPQLQSLDLSNNRLSALPGWLGQLTQLKGLLLNDNRLEDLPSGISELAQLKVLSLAGNRFKVLPECVCKLQNLKSLGLTKNAISELPDAIGNLKSLTSLVLGGERVITIPAGEFPFLEEDYGEKCGNNLNSLPITCNQLTKLTELFLDGNPLNPELAAAYKEGLDAVKRYLRELGKGARRRYEAKLLILGDGNEGKTCVSRALRGLPFRKQNNTRGVDVVHWKFQHPDDATAREKDITLNIWDFEGQEISHQTHQFFLTSQSLYLLVFKCRDQFLIDRAEYWLDTIRARAPQAKVAIVISQCEGRSPFVPLDRIQAQYHDLLAKEWFFPVGCEDGSNIPRLQAFLRRWAADLEFMGSLWPASYGKAEAELKAKAKRGTERITRDNLCKTFAKAGLNPDGYEDAAGAMSRLGVITQFPDCPDLRDFVVLRPQWLTKAISKVMEDKQLSEDKGEITLPRMEALWKKDYPGMFATFHDCMKEFELCYDLEDDGRSCLIPLRFGYLRPPIPWSGTSGFKERRVEYKLNIRPPMGIMSRFIVKTHHLIVKTPDQPKGVFWHNGVFLRTGEGPLCSEALCEFVPEERKLRLEVRAAYPQNMFEQMHAYVKAVFSFFSGLEAERSYGCIKVNSTTGGEERCSGLYTEKRLYTAISKARPILDCEFEDHEVDPRVLVGGFSSFNEFVTARVITVSQLRRELNRQPEWTAPFLRGIGGLLDWVTANGGKLDQLLQAQSALGAEFRQEAELKLHEYLALTSQMLDDRDYTAAPGLISISTKDRSKWNPAGYFKNTYVLTPYCECQGNIHPCKDGQVEFTKDRVWWKQTAPWLARGTKLLSAGITLAFAGMPLALGPEVFDVIKDDVAFMDELAKQMELEKGDTRDQAEEDDVAETGVGKGIGEGDKESRLTRWALAAFMKEMAPANYHARRWGSLRRVRMSDDSYRWLCEDCAKRGR